MGIFTPRQHLCAAALILTVLFFTSCSHYIRGASKNPVHGLHLSEDGRLARISPSAFTEDIENILSGRNTITLVHEVTGIRMTSTLFSDKSGYHFANYGLLLKKGDRVEILLDGVPPAFAILE